MARQSVTWIVISLMARLVTAREEGGECKSAAQTVATINYFTTGVVHQAPKEGVIYI